MPSGTLNETINQTVNKAINEKLNEKLNETLKVKLVIDKPTGEFGAVIIPICMFLFLAIGRVFARAGEGLFFGLGVGFLFRTIEIRRSGRRPGGIAFAAGFFLAFSIGLLLRAKAAAPLFAIACGLLLMTYFKRF
jgi:hypothetical protein